MPDLNPSESLNQTGMTPLSKLSVALENEDFLTHILPISESNIVEQLFINLGQDDNQVDLLLQIIFINDITKALGVKDEETEAQMLQLLLILPFKMQLEAAADTAFFLLALNRILPVGAFGFSQKEGTVYYQYTLAVESQEVNSQVVVEVLSIIAMFVVEFIEKIAKVSSGEKKAEDMIQEMEKEGIIIPPMGTPSE